MFKTYSNFFDCNRCTIVHGTPTMFIDLVKVQEQRKEDISPEIAVCGGAPNTPHLFQQILDVLKIKKVKVHLSINKAL